MRKVPPILKPIALLTLSILIATTSGILNNSSYRQVKPTTELSTIQTTDSSRQTNSVTNETNTVEQQTQNQEPAVDNTVEESSEINNNEIVQSSVENSSAAVPSTTEESQTASTQQAPAETPVGGESGDSQ